VSGIVDLFTLPLFSICDTQENVGLCESAHPRALECIRSEGEACFVIPTIRDNRVITAVQVQLGMGIPHGFFDFSKYLLEELQAPTHPILSRKMVNSFSLFRS
jgi:hypothetical protein